MKRVFSFILALVMVFVMLPAAQQVDASNAYTINGVSVRYDDSAWYPSAPSDCWNYARAIYNKIWGVKFSNSFNESSNALRNLSDSELTLTKEHLKEYVSKAALGSCLRICDSEYLHGTDGWGHSQIIVQKDENGFTVLEGGLSSYPHCREKYYTWAGYVNSSWPGKYAYIKYIKWPGAPAYQGDGSSTGSACECSETYAGNYICTTSNTNLYIRSGHSTSYSTIGSIPSGATVYVSKASGISSSDWGHVTYNGVSGYASMQYLKTEGKQIHTSTSSVSLKLGGTSETNINVWTSGYYSGSAIVRCTSDPNMVDCEWGDWADDGTIPLTIRANKEGTTAVTVSVRDKETEKVLDEQEITVTITAKTYSVTYNANGGSGAPSSQTKRHGTVLTLSSTKPKRTGYTFLGWSTSSSATSAKYNAGGTFTSNANTTLYAVWKANTYTVSYTANGGSGAPGSQTKTYGKNLTLSTTKPTRTGYVFQGWATSASATSAKYNAGGTFTSNASTTLYAVWEAKNGWTSESGKWTYYQNGAKVKNCWKQDSKGWCYLGADGYMVTNGWRKDSVGWCYVGADGYMVKNKWVKDSVGWCYLGADGRMVTNRWVKDSVGWCYVGADGYMVKNKWVKDSVGWCYLGADGRMVTNRWVTDSVGWCYIGADGYAVTNCWKRDSVGWCYLDANGSMTKSAWVYDGGKWYYCDGNGYMVTGTKTIGGKTYKFNSSGVWIG